MTTIHHETSSESWVKFMAIIANHFILLINFKAYQNMLTFTLSNKTLTCINSLPQDLDAASAGVLKPSHVSMGAGILRLSFSSANNNCQLRKVYV